MLSFIPLFQRGTKGDLFQLAATTLVAVLFGPQTALADNECGIQVGTTHVVCDQTSYGDGVTYDALGNLFIDFTNATRSTIGGNGVTLTGDGSEDITFDSATTGTELQSSGTTGALLGVTTVNGDIVIDTEEMDADASAANVTHAIFAESTGSGSIDITTMGIVDAAGSNPADSIGIEAITGSGSLTITALGTVNGNDAAIDATTGTGLLTINIDATGGFDTVGGSSDVGIRTNTNGDAIINVGAGRSVSSGIQSTGGTLTLNNNGTIRDALDFSGVSYTFNNNAGGLWDPGDSTVLAAGTVNNAGTIEIDRGDTLSTPGTTFTGSGGVLQMNNVTLNGQGQDDCSAPTLAGCLDLSGGTTAGQTEVLVRTSVSDPSGPPFLKQLDNPISPGIVVVDVGGGTSQAGHFVLSPDSFATSDSGNVDIYAEDSVYGAVLETGGLFDYALLYNPNTQQHLLSSVPQVEALQYASLIHESLSIWHTASDTIAGRQADLRHGGQRGGWVRVFADQTERDFKPSVTTHGNTFNYDRRYVLYTGGVIAGYDLTADDSHVLGVHLGFMTTKLEHNDSETVDETRLPSSVTFGAYGGWWNEAGLTLDGALNVNLLDIEHNVRRGLEDTRTNVFSVGARAEAGWRMPLSERFYVQPLATASYVTADIENLDMRDYDAKFEDSDSARAALGVRLGGDAALNNGGKLGYWLTARAWEEYSDKGNVQFKTDGDPLVIQDDISGSFQEVNVGVKASNKEGNLTAFFSTGLTSGNDTDSYNFSLGARLNW